MKPNDIKLLRFGIEIETIASSRKAIAEAIKSVVGGEVGGDTYASAYAVTAPDGRIWKVVRDGSLVPTTSKGGEGAEIVSPILTYDDIETVQSIVRATREAGAYINDTCGIHVHVEAKTLGARGVTNLVKIVYKQQALIEAALGIHNGRQRYCRSIDPSFIAKINKKSDWTLEQLNTAWYGYYNPNPSHYDGSRYRAINLHSIWYHGTIEFRWANSSLHAGHVKTYIQFALAICAKAKDQRSAQSAQRVYDAKSAKYDLRVFLLSLQMIGPEFKTARDHLLSKMPGSAAWKNGKPAKTNSDDNGGEE